MPEATMNLSTVTRTLRAFCICLILVFATVQSMAQRDVAERRVSLSLNNVPLERALSAIAEQADFRFSYNTELIPVDSVVIVSATNQTVGDLITQLFAGRIGYKVVGKHVILKPSRKPKKEPEPAMFTLRGTVSHARTRKPLANASVFAVNRKYATLTNGSGGYELELAAEQKYLAVSVRMRNFLDTVIVIRPGDQTLDVLLLPVPENIAQMPMREVAEDDLAHHHPRDVEELGVVKFMVPERQRLLNINFDSFLTDIPAQVSLLPSVGTNRLVSGSVENNLSINILAGYSYAVKGLEVGGLVNITRTNMKGLQAAGLGNVVGGNVLGLQAAGLFNNCRGSLTGLQSAGLYNIVLDTIRGVQAAGLANVCHGYMEGGQVSGFYNLSTNNLDGAQIAGFMNVAHGDVNVGQAAGFINLGENIGGAQVAGFINIAKGDVDGAQAAGYINIADNVNAAQVAGFANMSTGEVKGVQIAGFLNIASKVGGGQIGLFNFADTVAGVSFGLFSFVKKGYHEVEFSTNELIRANVAFKTGTRHLYNNFTFGLNDFDSNTLGMIGYGFGTEFWLKRWIKSERFRGNLDVTTHQVQRNFESTPTLDLVNRVSLAGGVHLGKALAITAGPVFSLHVSRHRNPETGNFITLAPYQTLFQNRDGETYVGAWIGWRVAVRI